MQINSAKIMNNGQWLEILTMINVDVSLNESNLIEKIKDELKATDLVT